MVGQFQRRLRNCHLHSFMAVCSPAAMACKMPGFCRISRRWRRLSRARLGSRTNCTFLELVRRLDEEATLTIPLAHTRTRGSQSQAAGSLCMYLLLWPSKPLNWCVLASHGSLKIQFSLCTTVAHAVPRPWGDSKSRRQNAGFWFSNYPETIFLPLY